MASSLSTHTSASGLHPWARERVGEWCFLGIPGSALASDVKTRLIWVDFSANETYGRDHTLVRHSGLAAFVRRGRLRAVCGSSRERSGWNSPDHESCPQTFRANQKER